MAWDSAATADEVHHGTDVRFGIRTMLLVTIPAALVASVAGLFLRSLAADERSRVAVAWTIWWALVVAWIAIAATRRVRFEKRAGRMKMRLPIYGGNPSWRLINRYMLSGSLVMSGVTGLLWCASKAMSARTNIGALGAVFDFVSLTLAAAAACSVTLWWWGRDVRLCEGGVLWDRRIMPWREASIRWDPDGDALTMSGLDEDGIRLVCSVLVSEERRAAVTSLLHAKIPDVEEQPIRQHYDESP